MRSPRTLSRTFAPVLLLLAAASLPAAEPAPGSRGATLYGAHLSLIHI